MPNSKYKNLDYFPLKIGMISGVIAVVIRLLLSILMIQRSSISTAAIGYLFLPIEALEYFFIFAIFGFFAGIVIRGVLEPIYRKQQASFIVACIVTWLIVSYGVINGVQMVLTYQYIHKISQIRNSKDLSKIFFEKYLLADRYKIYLVAAFAQHHKADGRLLAKIAHVNNPYLHKALEGSILNLALDNSKGFSAARLIVRNPNVNHETLFYLSRTNDFYLLSDIASNPKIPASLYYQLFDKVKDENGYLIKWGLLANPKTPIEIRKALKDT